MAKKVEAKYKGHTFLAVNKWFGGLKFYHNEVLIAHYKGLFATDKNAPLVSKTIFIDNSETLVEVYGYAISKVLLQIRINGEMVAGDEF